MGSYTISSCSPDNDPSVRRGEVSIDLTIDIMKSSCIMHTQELSVGMYVICMHIVI